MKSKKEKDKGKHLRSLNSKTLRLSWGGKKKMEKRAYPFLMA
jgi:hypothetical protein